MESPTLCESRELFCYPRPLLLSQGGKWRVLWGGDQPSPASFSPHSLELRNRPLVPACATMDRRARGDNSQPRQRTSPFPDFQRGDTRTPAPRCQKAAPSCPRARAGGSAKGPGAVRFRRKGPQVGAAAAECERFRWEITGDNPARDGAARQETSSGEAAAGQGGGVPLGKRTAAGGTATKRRATARP